MTDERRKPETKQDLKDVIQGMEFLIAQLNRELEKRMSEIWTLEKQLSKSRRK